MPMIVVVSPADELDFVVSNDGKQVSRKPSARRMAKRPRASSRTSAVTSSSSWKVPWAAAPTSRWSLCKSFDWSARIFSRSWRRRCPGRPARSDGSPTAMPSSLPLREACGSASKARTKGNDRQVQMTLGPIRALGRLNSAGKGQHNPPRSSESKGKLLRGLHGQRSSLLRSRLDNRQYRSRMTSHSIKPAALHRPRRLRLDRLALPSHHHDLHAPHIAVVPRRFVPGIGAHAVAQKWSWTWTE